LVLAHPIDGQVVQYCEYPTPGIVVPASLVPATDCALQAVLYEVVGRRAVPHQAVRVASQGRNERFDQQSHDVHDKRLRKAKGHRPASGRLVLVVAVPGPAGPARVIATKLTSRASFISISSFPSSSHQWRSWEWTFLTRILFPDRAPFFRDRAPVYLSRESCALAHDRGYDVKTKQSAGSRNKGQSCSV
jgi:hypothetical protein